MTGNQFKTRMTRRAALKLLATEAGALALTGCGAFSAVQATPTTTATIPPLTPSETATATQPVPTNTTQNREAQEFLPPVNQVGTVIPLPPPNLSDPAPLMAALSQRRSTRACLPDTLSLATLSDLLWAGFGVNRSDSGMRTAPSAYNMQDIHGYLADAGGLWLFEASMRQLVGVLPDDLRSLTNPPANAPIQLIYVSRYPAGYSDQEMLQFSWAHTGFIAQNVYLYCAAAGLATVVRSSFDHDRLAEQMGLQSNEHITLVQAVGKMA